MFPLINSLHSPAAAEAYSHAIEPMGADVDAASFRIEDPLDIAATLQAMAADGDLVTIYPAKGDEFLSGRIAEVLPQDGRLVVEARGLQAPEPGLALLVSMPQGIKLQFCVSGSWQQGAPGEALYLTADLPGEITHLQRRRFPRLGAPVGPFMRVEFMLNGKPCVMSVDDLSIGGIGLRSSAGEGRGLMQGKLVQRVRLELGQSSPMMVDLEICSRRPFRSFLAGEQLHFGCRFVDLAPAVSAELQRILNQFDAERRGRGARP